MGLIQKISIIPDVPFFGIVASCRMPVRSDVECCIGVGGYLAVILKENRHIFTMHRHEFEFSACKSYENLKFWFYG